MSEYRAPCYDWHALRPEVREELANALYQRRFELKMTLSEVCRQVDLDIDDIDNIECLLKSYFDFNDVITLLDFYDLRLNLLPDDVPGLSDEIYQKYFRAADSKGKKR